MQNQLVFPFIDSLTRWQLIEDTARAQRQIQLRRQLKKLFQRQLSDNGGNRLFAI